MKGSWRGIAFGMICGVLLAGAIAVANTPSAPELSSPPLGAAELASLSVYLLPAEPAPLLDQYGAFLPALEPLAPAASADEGIGASTLPEQALPRNVSAIVAGGPKPLAIIDDATVSAGTLLPGGARVVSIQPDHVLVREADGTLRTLRLKAG